MKCCTIPDRIVCRCSCFPCLVKLYAIRKSNTIQFGFLSHFNWVLNNSSSIEIHDLLGFRVFNIFLHFIEYQAISITFCYHLMQWKILTFFHLGSLAQQALYTSTHIVSLLHQFSRNDCFAVYSPSSFQSQQQLQCAY